MCRCLLVLFSTLRAVSYNYKSVSTLATTTIRTLTCPDKFVPFDPDSLKTAVVWLASLFVT